MRRLADQDPSIVVTGQVPDIRPYLWQSAVAVAPLFEARGLQNKVLEAAAAGLPSVVTSPVWAGLPQQGLAACRLADDPHEFAAAVNHLLSLSPAARRAIAARADLASLTWAGCLSPLCDLIPRRRSHRPGAIGFATPSAARPWYREGLRRPEPSSQRIRSLPASPLPPPSTRAASP